MLTLLIQTLFLSFPLMVHILLTPSKQKASSLPFPIKNSLLINSLFIKFFYLLCFVKTEKLWNLTYLTFSWLDHIPDHLPWSWVLSFLQLRCSLPSFFVYLPYLDRKELVKLLRNNSEIHNALSLKYLPLPLGMFFDLLLFSIYYNNLWQFILIPFQYYAK